MLHMDDAPSSEDRRGRLHTAIRQATDARHRALEALPFFQGLAGDEVNPRAWAGYLEALRIVYGALDEVLPAGAPGLPLDILDLDLESATLRAADAAPVMQDGTSGTRGHAPVARVRAQLLAHRIRVLAAEDPDALAGTVYVLEGAALGARVLWKQARAAGRESRWLQALAERGGEAWEGFLDTLGDLEPDAATKARILDAAVRTFDDFASVGRALEPLLDGLERDMANELNPHAGAHPIPSDPAILEASLRAGERSWEDWPYYRERYGDRGRAFTRSDSAWLTTLGSTATPRALEEIVWLADLLASRGMPRLLMEAHLKVLHEELMAVDPEAAGTDRWGFLVEAAELLGARRRAHVTDRSADGIARRFDERVPDVLAARLPGTGRLLAAALADEADGLRGAVRSLESWLADPDRFPKTWIDEVQRTVRTGRKRLSR
jgi:heme oxygenase